MIAYKLKLELHSDNIPGAAGGHGSNIDKEVMADALGLPFIPARRMKGILKYSLREVLSFLNCAGNSYDLKEVPEKIFGYVGENSATRFTLENFYLEEYDELYGWLAGHEPPISPETIKNFFTYLRSFTAIIDEDTAYKGTAEEGTLRTFRVLKQFLPGGESPVFISMASVPDNYEELFLKACSNARRMGLMRNRGFGHITISAEKVDINHNVNGKGAKAVEMAANDAVEDNNLYTLPIEIETLQKVLIRTTGSDENMVSSLNYIRAANIMGLLIQLYLETKENDETFFNLFLRGKLRFSDATPLIRLRKEEKGLSINSFHCSDFLKTLQGENKLVNTWNSKWKKNKTEENKGFVAIQGVEVGKMTSFLIDSKTQLSLHHARNKDSGIVDTVYNYQAIAPRQEFLASITGKKSDLEMIKKLLAPRSTYKLGASQTAEYGECRIKVGEIKEYNPDSEDIKNDEQVIMVLASDTIIYNAFGYPTANQFELLNYLNPDGKSEIKIEKSTKLKHLPIENYIKVWKSKKPSDLAIKAGNAFLLNKLPGNWKDLLSDGLGERTHEGFGKVLFLKADMDISETIQYIREFVQPKNLNGLAKHLQLHIENSRRANELVFKAMEDAQEFIDPTMGNLARHLMDVLENHPTDFIEAFKKLSPRAKGETEKYMNSKGVSLQSFIKEGFNEHFGLEENDPYYIELRKAIIKAFLVHLEKGNKIEKNRLKNELQQN